MLNFMSNYYSEMKAEVGIEDNSNNHDEDNDLDKVLRTLRPNTTPSNFLEFMDVRENC